MWGFWGWVLVVVGFGVWGGVFSWVCVSCWCMGVVGGFFFVLVVCVLGCFGCEVFWDFGVVGCFFFVLPAGSYGFGGRAFPLGRSLAGAIHTRKLRRPDTLYGAFLRSCQYVPDGRRQLVSSGDRHCFRPNESGKSRRRLVIDNARSMAAMFGKGAPTVCSRSTYCGGHPAPLQARMVALEHVEMTSKFASAAATKSRYRGTPR